MSASAGPGSAAVNAADKLVERVFIATRRFRTSASHTVSEDLWLEGEGGWKLFARFHRPAQGAGPWPAVLLVPGLGGTSANFERWRLPLNVHELASIGVASLAFDPAGRGHSWGSESYGGPEHQGDVRVALRALAQRHEVDRTRIGVVSMSLGAASVAKALADSNPAVRFWIDWEGPCDREIITAGGRRMAPALGHTLEDDAYWYPREAVRHVGRIRTPYLRYQSIVDHAQPGELRHAERMIRAAASGALPWFQLNDHPRSVVPVRPTFMRRGIRPARRWMHERLRELLGIA